MPQTNEGVLLVVGAIFFLIGLLGGGFEISAIKIPSMGKYPRILASVVGAIFMVLAISRFLFQQSSPTGTPDPSTSIPVSTVAIQQTTQQPGPTQPAPQATSSSTNILFAESFDDLTHERGYNPNSWSCNNCEVGNVSPENGSIRLEVNGPDLALNLSSKSAWSSSQVGYLEGKLKLMQDENKGNGTVDLSLHTTLTSKYWQTGCLITPSQNSLTQAEYGCEIFTVDAQKQWNYEYRTPTTPTAYGEWHTMKIEVMPNTFELRFYLDDKVIGQHTPMDADELKDVNLTAQIGIYTYDGKNGHLIAYADDILVAPVP